METSRRSPLWCPDGAVGPEIARYPISLSPWSETHGHGSAAKDCGSVEADRVHSPMVGVKDSSQNLTIWGDDGNPSVVKRSATGTPFPTALATSGRQTKGCHKKCQSVLFHFRPPSVC